MPKALIFMCFRDMMTLTDLWLLSLLCYQKWIESNILLQ